MNSTKYLDEETAIGNYPRDEESLKDSDTNRPFCKGLSKGNEVDGLPLAVSELWRLIGKEGFSGKCLRKDYETTTWATMKTRPPWKSKWKNESKK